MNYREGNLAKTVGGRMQKINGMANSFELFCYSNANKNSSSCAKVDQKDDKDSNNVDRDNRKNIVQR